MIRAGRRRARLLAAALLAAAPAFSAEAPPPEAVQRPGDAIPWVDAPATMPPGTRIAVLEGHPQTEGFFTMRLKVPPGTKLPPHTHPKPERVTVLSGAVFVGFGKTLNRASARKFSAGSFYVNPPGVPHYLFMDEETVIQITGEGPWRVEPVRQ